MSRFTLLACLAPFAAAFLYAEHQDAFLPGYPRGTRRAYDTSQEALKACDDDATCGGVTREAIGVYTLRRWGKIAHSDTGEFTFVKNADADYYARDTTAGESNVFLHLPRTLEEAHQMLPTLRALASLSETHLGTGNEASAANKKSSVSYGSSEEKASERPDSLSNSSLQAKHNDDDNDASLHRLIPGPFLAQATEVFARCEGNNDGVFTAEPWLILQRAAQQCAALDQSATPNSCPKELRHWTAFNLAIQMQRPCRAGWARVQKSALMTTGQLEMKFVVEGGTAAETEEVGGKLGLPGTQLAAARRLYWGAALSAKAGDASVWQRWAALEEMDGRPNACVQVLSRGAAAVAATVAVASSTHAKHPSTTTTETAVDVEGVNGNNEEIANNAERAIGASQLYHSLGAHLHDHRAWGPALTAFQNALQIAASSDGNFFEPLAYYEWHYGLTNQSISHNNSTKDGKKEKKKMKKNQRTKTDLHRSNVPPLNAPLDAARLQAASQTLYMGHMLADWSIVDSLRPPTLDVLALTLRHQRSTQRGSRSISISSSSIHSQGANSGLAAVAMAWDEAFATQDQDSSIVEHSSQRHASIPQEEAAGTEIEALAPLPALHPWMSMCLPMPPQLRLAIAEAFAFRLHTIALAPAALGGQALPMPRFPSPQELAQKYYLDYLKIQKTTSSSSSYSVSESTTSDKKRKHRRLRVGFVSADFKQKATAYLCVETFQHFNRSRMEVFLYATTPDNPLDPSPWRRALLQSAEHFIDLDSIAVPSALEASKRVLKDKLDVLIDLDGYSNEGLRRSELFVLRHAPVTVAWFVYVSTLGNPLVDYIVADTIVAPHEVATHMSGKMLHLPHTFFPTSHRWLYPLDLPLFGLDPSFDVSRVDLGLPYRRPPSSHFKADAANSSSSNKSNTVTSATSDAAFVFACFNKHLKIRSELFACWCSVLRRLPNAKLWLLEYPKESQAQLRQAATSHGVLPDQLVFSAFVSTAEENWLRLWRGADAVLDTTVYGAHTSAVDALWAGLPVVTCVGHCGPSDEPSEHTDQMASRVAASLLTAALNNGSRSTITTASLSSIYPSSTTPRTELNSESNSVAEAARAAAARNDALETLITPSLEAYATTMFKLATSPQWYDNLRHQLEESRHTSPLWDAKGYADHFTEGLFEAWHQHLSGNSPRSIRVAAEGS